MSALMLVPWIVAALGCPAQAGAQPPAKQAEPKVNVTIVTILASDRCKCIDARLKEIAAELQRIDPKMTGFALVSMTQRSLPANEKGAFVCVEDAVVEVVIHHCVDKNDKVCLGVTAPLQNEIVYETICGKFFLIVTRYQAREHIPPMWVAKALAQALSNNPLAPILAADTLLHGRCQARLIVAVRVQPCIGK